MLKALLLDHLISGILYHKECFRPKHDIRLKLRSAVELACVPQKHTPLTRAGR